MIDQERLRGLTESYLKSLISEVSGSLSSDFDSFAAFGELGIDSFNVLKIIRRLEADFGTLPKSLLFENFTISDLANYFVCNHEQTLTAKFGEELHETNGFAYANGWKPKLVEVPDKTQPPAANRVNKTAEEAAPIRILEKKAYEHPELRELVQTLYARYRRESSVSRGTRKIAPNLFVGSEKRGYFNYGRNKNLVLVYAYTGPKDYLPVLLEEMHQYCVSRNFQLNILADRKIPSIGDTVFSATPFGVGQRIQNLKQFTLEGGPMRRLRYQVSKFEKSGVCKTQEYHCGSSPEIDRNIVAIIDKWCEPRRQVNPLIHEAREEILAGTLGAEHRLFLTYLDDVLQNVILISAMCSEENGYLMDLEFYLPAMPLGGLEFAIVHIINILVGEGCDVLSLGATLGCKLDPSPNADPEIDKILDDLREQNIFNDQGNFQFKNKFRPESKAIFLCRPVGSGDPDSVIDIIMMIADPLKNQTSEEESSNAAKVLPLGAALAEPAKPESSAQFSSVNPGRVVIDGNERSGLLSDFGFNPLNLPYEHVEFDLKTDSWAQLQMPSIDAQMRNLHAQLQQPANVDGALRAVFPFAHFVLTASGQAAEDIFFRAWSRKGLVLQNLLFPSTIFHQIDKGFTNKELPDSVVFDLNSHSQYKGNMDWEALQAHVAQDPSAIAFVCIEVSNNAAGGCPVSMQHLRDVKALVTKHSIPLVIDGTRVVENAQFLIEQDSKSTGKSVWTIIREMLSVADAVIGSLTKDFCVNKGGIIATNDVKLFHRLEELVQEAGPGLDLIDTKMIALSLQNRKQVEARVLRRMQGVRVMWQALREHNVPVVQPVGGHCVLIDVKQIPEFKNFKYPVASFLAWMYVNTGIRAAAHSVGMQKRTSINDLVRLAIPVGVKRDQIDSIISRLLELFSKKVNIPEIVLESSVLQPLGGIHSNYRLIAYHNTDRKIVAGDLATAYSQRNIANPISSTSRPVTASTRHLQSSSVSGRQSAALAPRKTESTPSALNGKSRKTQDIAIVGMAGRYPKATNLSELWENLRQGKDCIEEIPAERYELRPKQGATKKYRGGFIDDVDKFDSLFFNISPRESAMLDPQERLFLEVAWEAIEDAGYYPEMLASADGSRDIGVFVGAVWAMYQMFHGEEDQTGKKINPNSFLWTIANRVSYWMNLSGPSLTLDTACSSSLTALHLACEAIYAGECSAAIVGGVNLDLHEAKLEISSVGGGLSKDGVCRSFGKGADGAVPGEGIGALFLKSFDQAIRDKDNIYGVIKSAVINHGGRTSGYTVPNPRAQTNLILSALEKGNIDARSISYVEAHGTGTELGDPIEISGLTSAFKSYAVENQTCAIGSIKSNIGHLEAAAGVVSVSKVLLQMKHRQLVPSLHSSELNEFIDFKNSPFYVVQRLEDWKSREMDGVPVPLRAGVSSFGAGGANAHVILESYERLEQDVEQPANQLIFPLSARTEEQLREMAVRLAKAIKENNYRLVDIAHTLQVGRRSFEHRLAISATTKEELLDKLTAFLDGKKSEGIANGHVKNSESITRLLNRKEKEEFIQLLSQSRTPYQFAELWVEGLFADWRGFESDASCKRVSLPTYPFADKRHWVGKNSPARSFLQPAAAVHPMVDTNESTFERQLFKKTFHDRDFFIYDHHVANIPTLPGVAYLELARKAGEIAAGRKVQKIKNVVWISPISVQNSTPKEVFIELKPADTTVKFEVFSYDKNGNKLPHSQGILLYATKQEEAAEPEFIDLQAIRARCAKVIEGKDAYPKFKSFGLSLGPSFQVVQEVYKNENEILGVLKLPEFRQKDLESMVLQPSLLDGSMQAGVSAHLGDQLGEMYVPFSIGEVEILHPLQPNCFSYATEMQGDKSGNRESSRFVKSDVVIVDETGKVLIKVRESVGIPLREVYKKPAADGEAGGVSKLYYSYEWEKASLVPENSPQPDSRPIVLFDTQETLLDLHRKRLRQQGKNSDQVILVQPGDSFQESGKHSYKINPRNKEDYTKLFQSFVENNYPIENICFAWSLGHPDLLDPKCVEEALIRGVYSFLFVCQSLIQQKLESKVQLLYLYSTREDEIQPSNEAVSGFIKALRVEHPKMLSKTLEVRQGGSDYDQILNALSLEVQARVQDATAVRYQAEERYIKKLRTFKLEEATQSLSQGISLRKKGVYLITGGVGGLGLIFAEFLAKEHNAKLVLTGRSQLSKEREARLNELTSVGAEVLYLPADVSNREDVTKLIDETKARFGQINGIIHAAGVLRDSFVRNKKPEEMSAVFAPKIYGTLHLDEATQNENLDFFVTFSSVAAVGGNAGQCDYSFANHFMDSFVSARELLRVKGARFGKTLSLNWSLWADGGMKVDEQTEIYFKKTLGIKPLSTATGIEAFVKGLASEKSQFAVVEGVQEKVELVWGLRKKAPAPAMSASASSGQAQTPTPDGKDADLIAWLEKELSEIVMQFLKLEAEDVSTDKILLDLGFDSIGLTTFANTINEKYQLDITPVLFFDYPTIAELSKYLSVEKKNELLRFYQGSAGTTQTAAPLQKPHPTASHAPAENHQPATFAISKGWNPSALDRQLPSPISGGGFSPELRFVNQPIAIVGMSGVMPQSEDLDEFWENLKNSKDMITVIPPDRWRWEDYYGDPMKEANKSNSKWGGFMKEIDKFDPLFFGISPREARMMDPQQRIFLQTVWKAIEDSGQKVSDLSGSRTGLFVGVAVDDYAHLINSLGIPLDGYSAAGNSHSVLANRVSFVLNLHGPSAPIDTACSSSLIALHRAIESIHTGSCDMAIVGGVQIMASPAGHIAFASAGMLSKDGKCKTFDKRANGYVRGEGCGAIFLKTLKAAEADGNHIYAVIRATAENHGGKVTTLTAPNASAQSALLIEAYEKAHIDPTTVGYIECHGTGTSLGDPIEIQALSKAFSELYKKHKKAPAQTPHCGLSSVKTNIGHLECAAGVASVLKVLLAIKHKQIPANINFEEINPYINLKGSPFYIAEKLTPWEAATGEDGLPVPRRAGVSAFGFGGANAHVVLEEYRASERQSPARSQEPQLIVLSAKNEDRLRAYVESMLVYLEKENVELVDFAYTLQIGRDEMLERLALVASSTEDLKQKFAEILKGEKPKDCYRNNIRSKEAKSQTAEGSGIETLVRDLIESKELSRLAELWVSGAKIDWRLLHKSDAPRRISAPTYPFARERHWLPGADEKTMKVRQEPATIPSKEETNQHKKTSSDIGMEASLQSLAPVWNPARLEMNRREIPPETAKIVVLAADQNQLEWVKRSYPGSQLLRLAPKASVEAIERELANYSFDQLLWIAPDVHSNAGGASGSDELIEQQERGVVAIFRIIKALLQSGYAKKKLQWTIITGKTQRVLEKDVIQPAHAGVGGLVGSLAKEYPQWNLRLIDVDSLASVSARECLSLPWDKQGSGVACRQGEWFKQELVRMETPPQGPPVYRQNGVYVVIGGAGGIGEVWSRFMIENCQAKMVWIGRRECNSTIQEKINSMARLGHVPLYISADATKLDALEQAVKTIRETYPTIHGVVHSAIVLHDQSIARMEEAAFRAGLAAKVDTSVNMDRVFGNQELDFMLFFSSIVSFVKSPGQSNYSAGCTFKDSFAQKLQQERSYPVKIMNWGYWGGVGVVADESHNQLMRRMGIGSIESHEGMAALQALVNSEVRQMALFKTFNTEATAGLPISEVIAKKLLLQPSVEAKHTAKNIDARTETQSSRSAELPRGMGSEYIKRIIVQTLSDALKIDAPAIRSDAPVAEYGVDSIIGAHLVRTINESLQIELDPISLFEHSTVDDLTQHIWTNWQKEITAQLDQGQKTSQNSDSTDETSSESDRTLEHKTELVADADKHTNFLRQQEDNHGNAGVEPVAIIGMSGRFAGSESLDEFWQNLEQGKDLIKEVSRWSASECVTSESESNGYCFYGGFIDSIDQFDPSFFRISPDEAMYMDPQQRLFLEEAWKALEDAGYAGNSVNESRCGIYVGCGPSGYSTLFAEGPPAHAFWGNSTSITPARLAYQLNLRGPAIAVDSACSSSLVSVHLACQGLWSRETDMALAGGVCLNPTPLFYRLFNRARMLSPEGKCHSFDAKANGFVLGEGVGVIVLKRLRDALRDGDFVHGVIAGIGINQDGASNGLLAPNARAQETLERSVYDRFKINPETIQVIEAHGTGTLIGDAIEYLALSRAFREYTDQKQFCAIGTVKTNVGHTGTASGMAGILKLLLSLKHRRIPPSLHFQNGNPSIDFKSNPFYVNTQLKEWRVEDNQRRRGAVSAFGFSGTNAHLVIEDAPSVERAPVELPGYIAVLSAQTQEQLKHQAQNLLALLERTPGLSINDLSFTLFVGRMHLPHRLSCVARNQKELIHCLEQWIERGAANQVYTSDSQESRVRENASLKKFGNYCIRECENATDAAAYLENLAAIAELYAKGYSLDFRTLFSPDSRRIPLPTYPFAREHYWVDTNGAAKDQPMAATAALGPLKPMEVRIASGKEYVPPRNDVEKQLVEIWAQVLNLAPEKIGINDNFFELGGNSLLATQLTSKIRERLDIELPLTALFECSSVTQVAELCVNAVKNDIPPISPVDRTHFERLPLSFAQERLWFSEQLAPGTGRYNLYRAVTISGELDIDRLEQAFNLVIARHENLRTVFPSEKGQAQQLILDSLDFKLERIDLSRYPSKEERHSKTREICQKEAARPFDLARGPLLRSCVIKHAEQEHILLLIMHHIISDGWSVVVLTRELDLTMQALRQDGRPNLPPLPIQYVDYVVWQRNRLEAGGVLKQQLAYWQEKLAGVTESLDLPTDYPRPKVRSFVGATYEFTLDAELTGKLKNLAERKGATLYMVLLAAFKVLLYRYSGQSDICVGTLIANRQYAETATLIGMFINMLALRSQVEGEDTFSALLSQVKATCLEAYEHQDAPFEKVVERLRPERNAAANPIFQVMLILQNIATMDHRFPRYTFEGQSSDRDLTVECIEIQDGLEVTVEYSTALYKPQTIARMAGHFTALCKAITATPDARISDLEYLSDVEKHQVLSKNIFKYCTESSQFELAAAKAAGPANLAPLPGTKDFSAGPGQSFHDQAGVTASEAESNGARVSEEVWWQEGSRNSGYEKVTF